MGNSLKNRSGSPVAHVDDSAFRAPKAKGIAIRVIPNPSPPSPSSELPPAHTVNIGSLSIGSSQGSSSNFLPTSSSSGQERQRSNKSLSLKSFKSWNHSKSHNNGHESDPLPEPYLPYSPLSLVASRPFTDILSDALQLTEYDNDKLLPNFAAQEETISQNFAERDWIREYFESIEPCDVAEQDIEQRRYYIFQRVWRKDIQVPLKDPMLIVHWACGAGPWETSVARQFPDCRVIGIDFRPMHICHKDQDLKGVEFRQLSPGDRNECHGLDGFQKSSVDLIVMRRVWFLGTDTWLWDRMLAQALKILKPGGWIEIYDIDRPVVPSSDNPNDSKCITKIEGWRSTIRKVTVGLSVERRDIYRMLIDTGFTRPNGNCVGVPVGEWASTQDLKETGYLVKDLWWRYIKYIGRWIREINGISGEEFKETMNGAMREFEQCRAHMSWLCVTAQKPST